jgi:hypothetical protein
MLYWSNNEDNRAEISDSSFQNRGETNEFDRLSALSENVEHRLELIDRELVEKIPTQLHALIVHLFSGFLLVFFREYSLERVFVGIISLLRSMGFSIGSFAL